MFIEAAHAVAKQVTPEQVKLGMLFPPQSNILEVEVQTAARAAKLVFDPGLVRMERPSNVKKFIRQHAYKPEYQKLTPASCDKTVPESDLFMTLGLAFERKAGSPNC
jgi:malate dehydrogenase (oxaloacetate-decarboxylating)(NADP+)